MNPYGPRRLQTREPLRHLVIFCEGERTEVTYFRHYKRRGSGVKIEVRSDRRNDPAGLVDCALKRIKDPRDPLDIGDGDSIWCVFDADHHGPAELESAISKAGEMVRLVLSVPCFELWFILHYYRPTSRMSSNDAFNALRRVMPEYAKDRDVFEELDPKRELAIKNSQGLERCYDGPFPCVDNNPSTMVHHLVTEILNVERLNRSGHAGDAANGRLGQR